MGPAEVGRLVVRLNGDSTSFLATLKTVEAATASTAATLKTLAIGMTRALTVPATVLGSLGVLAFSRFDQAMTETFARMGMQSDEVRKKMESLAKEMSISGEVAFSPVELAKAYEELGAAGLSAEQSMETLGIVSKFAQAGMLKVDDAVKDLIGTMHAFNNVSEDPKQFAADMEKFGDVMTGVANITQASVKQVAESMTTDAAVAAYHYGMTLEELGGVIGLYAQQNKLGSEAGNTMGRMLRLLTKSFVAHRDVWEEMNIDITNGKGGWLDFASVLEKLEEATSRLGPVGVSQMIGQLGMPALQQKALMGLIGRSDELRKNQKLLAKEGTTAAMAATQMKSFNNQMLVLRNHFIVIGIELGNVIAPTLLMVNERIREAIRWWRGLSESSKRVIIFIGALVAISGPLILMMMLFSRVALLAAVSIQKLAKPILHLLHLTPLLTPFLNLFLAFGGVIGPVLRLLATGLSKIGFLLAPLTPLFRTLVVLVVAFLNPWSGLKPITVLLAGLYATFSRFGSILLMILNPLNLLKAGFFALGIAWKLVFGAIALSFSPMVTLIFTIIKIGGLLLIFIKQAGGVEAAWQKIVDGAIAFWNWTEPIRYALEDLGMVLLDVFVHTLEHAGHEMIVWGGIAAEVFGLTNVDWESTWANLRDTIVDTILFLGYMIENANQTMSVVWAAIQYQIVRFANVAVHTFTVQIPYLLEYFWRNFHDIMDTAFSYGSTVFMNLISNIANIFSNLPALIRGDKLFEDLWTPLTKGAENFIKEIPNIPERVVGQFEEGLRLSAVAQRDSWLTGFDEYKNKHKELMEERRKEDEKRKANIKTRRPYGDESDDVKELTKNLEMLDAVRINSAEAVRRVYEYQEQQRARQEASERLRKQREGIPPALEDQKMGRFEKQIKDEKDLQRLASEMFQPQGPQPDKPAPMPGEMQSGDRSEAIPVLKDIREILIQTQKDKRNEDLAAGFT